MFKNLFGPFPDEPLLYSFDKIVGLFQKFDSKFKRNNASNNATNETVQPTAVIDDATTENVVTEVVTSTQRSCIIVEKSETSSHTSKKSANKDNKQFIELETSSQSSKKSVKLESTSHSLKNFCASDDEKKLATSSHISSKCTSDDNKKLVSIEVNEVIEKREHKSTPRSIVKMSSSMECNYTLSKINVANRGLHSGRKIVTKKVNRSSTKSTTKRYHCLNAQAKGFGDVVEVNENHFQRKLVTSDGKKRMESILKKETKQQNVISAPNAIKWNVNRTERCNRTLNNSADRKVIKTEWAITRIYTFDDDSQTYEVMKKDKVLAKNGPVKRIFAIAPNLTTVAYDPIVQRCKNR